MQMSQPARPRSIALAAVAALALTACGGSPTTTDAVPVPSTVPSTAPGPSTGPSPATTIPTPATGQSPPPASAGTNIFPAIDVIDVASGDTVNLASATTGSAPTLVWFWAPH